MVDLTHQIRVPFPSLPISPRLSPYLKRLIAKGAQRHLIVIPYEEYQDQDHDNDQDGKDRNRQEQIRERPL